MTRIHTFSTGEVVYLVPRSLGCPTEAWHTPKVLIVATSVGTATVRRVSTNHKPTGPRITTAWVNLTRTPPSAPKNRRPARPTSTPLTPTGWQQPGLWDIDSPKEAN